jgi:hypothetical protein
MATRYRPIDLDPIFDQLRNSEPRVAITIGGSMLGYGLECAIGVLLREPSTRTEKDALFSDSGILGTFSAQIWAAFFLRLIGQKTRHDLDMIRNIRNICAHDMNPIDFNSPTIASRCNELHHARAGAKDYAAATPREKFTAATIVIMCALFARAAVEVINTDDARNLELVKYLDA